LSDEPEPEIEIELARSTTEEKENQIARLKSFKEKNSETSTLALQRLRDAAINGENVFAELMNAVRVCSLGQITETFFDVGGQYRRSM
jgi:methylmalonyl-CoA mutase